MSKTTRLKFEAARAKYMIGQFGQGSDDWTFNGATGCGHTCCQSIIDAFKGKRPTHNQLSAIMGYARPANNPRRLGTSGPQLVKALAHYGLHYRVVYGMSMADVVQKANQYGPAIVSVRYPKYPNWYRYDGKSRPSPFARPLGKAGRNQFYGDFAHWVVVAGGPSDAITTMEPNHRSPARPEKVVYDRVKLGDLSTAYRGVRNIGFNNLVAVVPTRSVI